MNFLIQFVAQFAPWIYAVCGLVALYNVYRIWLIRAERRQAVFALERNKAKRDLYNVFFAVMLLVLSMGSTYFISTVLPGALEITAIEPVPTTPSQLEFGAPVESAVSGLLPTPTFTPEPPTVVPTALPVAPPAQTPTPEVVEEVGPPAATAIPPAPVVQAPACASSQASILQPGNGQIVSGSIAVIGTATHDQFDYYKIEFAPGANAGEGYAYLAHDENQINSGVLATFNSTNLANGMWTLQLTVVDQTGNFPAPCKVTITVQN